MERNLSLAEVIRQGVDEFLRSSATVRTEDRVRRALDAAGRYGSGKQNGSEGHDASLAETYGP